MSTDPDIRSVVRSKYGEIAKGTSTCGCGPSCCGGGEGSAGAKIAESTEGIDQLARAERLGDGVDGQIASAQVSLDPAILEWEQVDLPRSIVGDHPPDAEAR